MTPTRKGLPPAPIVDFIDTSVLVEILSVPGKSQQHDQTVAELRKRQAQGIRFILPTATLIETGNHIFQVRDGSARRTCAGRFAEMLELTAAGETPWVLHERTWSSEVLRMLHAGGATGLTLVEHSTRQLLGTGDLSIVVERDLYAAKVRARVRIWTLEQCMSAWADPQQ